MIAAAGTDGDPAADHFTPSERLGRDVAVPLSQPGWLKPRREAIELPSRRPAHNWVTRLDEVRGTFAVDASLVTTVR